MSRTQNMTDQQRENYLRKARERNKKWREDNPERAKESCKICWLKNKEKYDIRKKEYQKKNSKELSLKSKKWAEENREKSRLIKKKWASRNPEKVKEKNKRWGSANKDKKKEYKEKHKNKFPGRARDLAKIRYEKNIESERAKGRALMAKRTEEIHDLYVAFLLETPVAILRKHPDLLEAKREQIKILRELKPRTRKNKHNAQEPEQPARSPR